MTKHIRLKRFIAAALSFCMCLGAISNISFDLKTIFAEEETTGYEEGSLVLVPSEEEETANEEEIITPVPLEDGAAGTGIQPFYIDPGGTAIYQDTSYSFEERAADLVARMTQQEKLSQMVAGVSAAIPRLGLNWWGWWNECLHGVSRYQNYANSAGTTEQYNTTSYPITQSMGLTWDTDLNYRVAQAIGEEARETADGNYRNLNFWTPTVNLSRDPRWGRGDESQGEDPFHSAAIASQFVNGMEGKDMDGNLLDPNGYLQSITTLKHYLANNTEFNRLNGSSNMSERDLREYYSDVYRRIIQASDPGSVMSSYQRINEVPSTVNMHTLDTLLRQTLGFTGYVTTDCDSMGEVTTASAIAPYAVFAWPTQNRQAGGHAWRPKAEPGLATSALAAASVYDGVDDAVITNPEMIAWSSLAGTDLECNGGVQSLGGQSISEITAVNPNSSYSGTGSNVGGSYALSQSPETPMGTLTENSIDINVHRLLTARMKIGEFDMNDGVVTWYNEVKERIENNYGEGWTFYNSADNGAPTMTEERKELAKEAATKALVLLRNDTPVGGSKPLLPLDTTKQNLKVAVIGYAANPAEGTPAMGPSTGGIGYVSGTQDKLQGGYSARFGPSAFNQFVYPFEGIKTAIKAENPTADVRFTQGYAAANLIGAPNADKLYANAYSFDDASKAAVEAAADWADVCIVYANTDLNTANEERDRGISPSNSNDNMGNSTLALSIGQVSMINAVKDINKNIVLVMETSGPNFIEEFEEDIPAMLFSSFNGQEKGSALADVLLGKYNPSGHTSITWYKNGDQLSDLRSYQMSPGTDTLANARENNTTNVREALEVKGRTYMYYDEAEYGQVMYPFGYGLSYTTFSYSNATISSQSADANATLTLSIDITNEGSVTGSVVPQLYVKTPSAFGDEYPIKRLRGFEMVKLDPNETKRVAFTLPVEEFKFFNESTWKYEVKTGTYRVQIGSSSADADEQAGWDVTVSGSLIPKVSVVTAKPVIKDDDAVAGIPTRLIYGVNTEVDPQLTICMSDDSLYGYVNSMTGVNTADYPYVDPPKKSNIPSSMSVTYRSNRPDTVEVNGAGEIITKAPGVATITATVRDSDSGTTGTCDFVVYVAVSGVESQATGIQVDGVDIPNFDGTTDKYEYGLPRGATTVPEVTATADSPSTVTVEQAVSIPGTAYVRVKGSDGATNTYDVRFGFLPEPDTLVAKNSGLWTVMSADGKAKNDTNGLSWTVPRTIATLHSNVSVGDALPTNIYLQNNVAGDWEATVKVSLDEISGLNANGLNAGIVLYQQRTNYVAVVLQRTSSTVGAIRFYSANNLSTRTQVATVAFNELYVFLKLIKEGNTVTAEYSADGENWVPITGSVALNESYVFPSLGLYAATDTALAVDPAVAFQYFCSDESDLPEPQILPTPENFQAMGGIGQVNLSWDAVPGATGYVVFMSETEGQPGTVFTNVRDGEVVTFTKADMAAGDYYFTIEAYDDTGVGEISQEKLATVLTVPVLSGILLDPATIYVGEEYEISAVYEDASGLTDQSVKWVIGNPNVLQAVTTSSALELTVKGLEAGISKVTVKNDSEPSVFGECYITVKNPDVSVEGVSLDKSTASLLVGSKETLTATVTPGNATVKAIKWSSSNAAVATVANGVVSAVGPGTATITVTTTEGDFTATCAVTVTAPSVSVPAEGVSLNKSTASLLVGDKETLTATVTPSNATVTAVRWSSSDTAVATVSNGVVSAIGLGMATITVTTLDGDFTAVCEVTVTAPSVPVEGVSLNKSTASLLVGNKETLTATVAPSNATNKSVAWSSSDTAVAAVSNGVITAISKGTATITVTTADGGYTANCTVAVNTSSSSGSKSGSNRSSSVATSTVSGASTTSLSPTNSADKNQKAIESLLSNGKKIVAELTKTNDSIALNTSTAKALVKAEEPLVIKQGNFTLTLEPPVLADLNGDIKIAMSPVTDEAAAKLLKAVTEAGGKGITSAADIQNIKITVSGKEVKEYNSPLQIDINVTDAMLAAGTVEMLTGIRMNNDGTIDKLGGVYDAKTKTFSFYTSKPGNYSVMFTGDVVKLSLSLNSAAYTLNGAQKSFDLAPIIQDGRTLVPIRLIAESFGAQVDWNDATKTATITLDGKTLNMTVGQMLDGMDAPAQNINGRVMVPLRFISEYFGANVIWDEATKSIEIYR